MELTYRGPDGRRGPVEDLDEIVRLIRGAGTNYWNVNAGDAGLIRRENGSEQRLSLYFLPVGDGVFQLVWRGSEGLLAALPTREPSRPKWVEIQVGGNPMRISSRQALNRDEAEKVIRHFAMHGTRDPRHDWVHPNWPFVE